MSLLAAACVVAAAADLAVYTVRLHHGTVYSFVPVRKYNAVSDGHGLYHFQYFGNVTETCLRTMLPHAGLWPCWYMHMERFDWTR